MKKKSRMPQINNLDAYLKAYQGFLEGKTLLELSKKLNIDFGTLRHWSSAKRWSADKDTLMAQTKEKLYVKVTKRLNIIVETAMQSALVHVQCIAGQTELFRHKMFIVGDDGKIWPCSISREDHQEFSQIVRDNVTAVSILRSVAPDMNTELGKELTAGVKSILGLIKDAVDIKAAAVLKENKRKGV
ncbi:MAG: hypothetical protein V2A69_16075 [Pseudomonadota bacterium]